MLGVGLLAAPAANDFFQFWWAGHLIATGRSPYDRAAWTAALAFGPAAGSVARNCVVPDAAACLWIYPPWTAWLFAPTGALDPVAGIAIQRIALGSALAIGGALWLRVARATERAAGPLLIALAACAPYVRDTLTGHFEGLLLIGLALIAIGLRDRRTWPVVAGVLLLALKPHLSLALGPLVLVWLISTRTYRTLAIVTVALAGLVVGGFASDLLAWPALLGRSVAKQELASSTTWGFASATGAAAAPAIAAAVLLVAIAALAVIWRGPRAAVDVVAAGAALSLAVAPYAQSYDMVLLVPAVAVAFASLRRAAAVVGAALLVAITWTTYVLELSGDPRAFAGLLPVIVLVLLASRVRQRRAATLSPS